MSDTLAQKVQARAHDVMLCAIETYNRPTFRYRDETFAILAINAWELLLKAKILTGGGDQRSSLYVPDSKAASGFKTNRSGSPITIELFGAVKALNLKEKEVPDAARSNLEALTAIRDNAVHLIVDDPALSQRVYALSAACVSNFLELASDWFQADWKDEGLYLLPLGFPKFTELQIAPVGDDDRDQFLAYLDCLISSAPEDTGEFAVALNIQVGFVRAKLSSEADLNVRLTNDPGARVVRFSDEQIRQRWPLTYEDLGKRMKAKFPTLVQNNAYHSERKKLEKEPQFANIIFLDPGNPKSGKKTFYSEAILEPLASALKIDSKSS